MAPATRQTAPKGLPGALALCGLLALTACGPRPESSTEINDPYEATNRKIHDFNKNVDYTLFGNDGTGGAIPPLPAPVAAGFSNVISNLGMPSMILNNFLQAKPGPALQDTIRMAINTTVGIGGIFDPATAIGIPAEEADFGETMYVWGVGEGAYLEVPFYGPTTERDFTGVIVDIAVDPLNVLADSRLLAYITSSRLVSKVGNRQRFSETYESILYDSADSYAQARLLYLQNRHYQLGIEEETFDPYEDPYAE